MKLLAFSITNPYGPHAGPDPERRLAIHAACWVLAALALFVGLMVGA
jgi:hypothetical protein